MTHTKGPWTVDYKSVKDGLSIYAAHDNGHLVAILHHQYSKAQEANAHLIAAAPNMLKALKRCEAYMVDYIDHLIKSKKPHIEASVALGYLDAAIAKARGQQ